MAHDPPRYHQPASPVGHRLFVVIALEIVFVSEARATVYDVTPSSDPTELARVTWVGRSYVPQPTARVEAVGVICRCECGHEAPRRDLAAHIPADLPRAA